MRLLPAILAMAAIVVASNILVLYPMGAYLTWGALTYPLAFLVTDLANRLAGPQAARRVVFAGFVTGIACSLIIGSFSPLVTLRVTIGSGLAFLVAQLLDVALFNRMRGGGWWKAPLISTLVSSSFDTAIFFTVAFSATLVMLEPANDVSWATAPAALLGFGPDLPFWVSMAVADWSVKILLAIVALVPFRVLVRKLDASVA